MSLRGDFESEEDGIGLSWRGDAKETLSDFTIEVSANDGSDVAISCFHVHRCLLGAGKQACKYFTRLFSVRSGAQLAEDHASLLKLSLSQSEVVSFPVFLDFIYGETLEVTTSTAPALLHMASYFGCKALHESIIPFIENDMTKSNAPIYFSGAEEFGLTKLSEKALEMCHGILAGADLQELAKLEAGLLARVIQSAAVHQSQSDADPTIVFENGKLPANNFLECCKCKRGFSQGWQCQACKYTIQAFPSRPGL